MIDIFLFCIEKLKYLNKDKSTIVSKKINSLSNMAVEV